MIPNEALSSTILTAPMLTPRNRLRTELVDFEDGGVGISDPSEGISGYVWRGELVGDVLTIRRVGQSETFQFSYPEIVDFSFTFDQNMRPFVCFDTGISAGYYWYDPTTASYQTTLLPDGSRSPRCTLDDKRNSQITVSDIILAYTRDGTLYFRAQRDRYEIEYTLMEELDPDLVMHQLGMGENFRLQFQLKPYTAPIVPTTSARIVQYVDGDLVNTNTFIITIALSRPLGFGERVRISVDGENKLATRSSELVYTYTVVGIEDGDHTFSAWVYNTKGNSGPVDTKTITVDTEAPAGGVAITAFTDSVGTKTSGQSTYDTSVTLVGTAEVEEGEVVVLFLDSVELAEITPVDGAWSYPISGLEIDTYTFTALLRDVAGNEGELTEEFSVVVEEYIAPPEYFYEVFTTSGTFQRPGDVTEVDVLVVAGGGGGGSRQGGGGGAGGVREEAGVDVSSVGSVTVTIGTGGNGGTSGNAGSAGGNSSFGSISATGGGRGGARSDSTAGGNGGSGGGGSMTGAGTAPTSGGTGTAGQGNNGGAGHQDESGVLHAAGGGGGGAKTAGQTAPGNVVPGELHSGDGGDGYTLEELGWGDAADYGAPEAVGGGGGGGAFDGTGGGSGLTGVPGSGGVGGGGAGGRIDNLTGDELSPAVAGTANTGGGGGGSGNASYNGAAGGSGLVVVRYARSEFDSNFDSVQLLTAFNGADAATSARDESSAGRTISFFGNAQLDTAQYKFSPSSLLLDGSGDYVRIADDANLELGSGDFTIEAWVRFNGDPSSEQCFLSKYLNTGNQRSWVFRYVSGDILEFLYSSNGSTNVQAQVSWNPSSATWYHVAVSRSGSTLYFFVDGTLLGTHNIGTTTIFDSTDPVYIGRLNSVGFDNNYFNGWIDEVRMTVGIARYTSAFTAPSAPFPRSAASA